MKKVFSLAVVFGYLLIPQLVRAQAPTLGTAANFVLFSSAGAVSNTGALSRFTGDIGTTAGAIAITVNVNGVLCIAGSAASTQAASDVSSASSQLDLTAPTYTQPAAPGGVGLLGNNARLFAGVYAFTQSTLIDSSLILDAQGNPNAVFIFKIQGTLSASTTTRIILANGALACNVFWQTSGAINLGAGSVMRGTIIAKSASISMDAGATLEGRALTATAGAITITNVLTYTPTGCGIPAHLGPAAPNIASTAFYVLFSSSGAISNTGNTYLTGDVGTNLGSNTGYNPMFVSGTIHTVPDASTAQAASDLSSLQAALASQPKDIELMYPGQFGNKLILTPHTYLLNAATALTDTLYLNAEGNPNAIFIIKVVGAFSTSVNAKVILTNCTNSSNVFWYIEGALSISDFSLMCGTFVVNNAAITIANGVTLNGRALTTTGALSTIALTADIPDGNSTCGGVPLPVGLLYFGGKIAQGRVLLEWANTEEISKGSFLIQKSSDAYNFETLGLVAAGNQSGKSEYHYSYTDAQPFTNSYYRIAYDDLHGLRKYSRTVYMNSTGAFTAAAFVGQSVVDVRVSGATAGRGTILLYAADGHKVAAQEIMLTKEHEAYTLEKPYQKGLYLLCVTSGGQNLYTTKLLVD